MAIRPTIAIASPVSLELSELLERLVGAPEREEAPTLDEVREAMAAGLTARMIGDGALAEEFIRLE